MHALSVGAAIRFGWETFKKRPWYLIGAPFLMGVVYVVIYGAIGEIAKLGAALALLVFLVNVALQMLYKIGLTHFYTKVESNVSTVTLKDFWYPAPFWRFLGASLLAGLLAFLGGLCSVVVAGILAGIMHLFAAPYTWGTFIAVFVALFVVVSLFLALALYPMQYIAVKHDLGPVDILKRSFRATQGVRGKILLLFLAVFGLNMLGFLALILGLFVTVSISAIATIHVSRLLDERAAHPSQ